MSDVHSIHDRICEHCGSPFYFRATPSSIAEGGGKYCSRKCHYLGRDSVPVSERFFKYVGKKAATGCIPWIGQIKHHGYGVIRSNPPERKMLKAHRVSFELFVGCIPDGLLVLHRCDNRVCINPVHLFLGTYADNIHDMFAKGRNYRRQRRLTPLPSTDG